MDQVCHRYGGSVGHLAWLLHLHAGRRPFGLSLCPVNVSSQIQNGRFKTGMCPYLNKPGGCPKGERCTYAHSEEERDRYRNMVKPIKSTKPRSGEQYRTSAGLRRSGDHGPIRPHTDTHTSPLNSFEAQRVSDFIGYPGMGVWSLMQTQLLT